MKTKIVIIALFISALNSLWAQEKDKFLEEGKEWKMALQTTRQSIFSEPGWYETLRVGGDTIINGLTCKNIVNTTNGSLFCTMYEQDNRVYIIQPGEEYGRLALDFNLKEGDVAQICLSDLAGSPGAWAKVEATQGKYYHERGRDFPCIKVKLKESSEDYIQERINLQDNSYSCEWIPGVGNASTGIVNMTHWVEQYSGGIIYTLLECRVGDRVLFVRDHSWEGVPPLDENPSTRALVEEGKVWVTRRSTMYNELNPDAPYSYLTTTLKGDTLVGFHLCKAVQDGADTCGFLYQIGDRVYYLSDGKDGDGHLIYDFGLKEGECADVYIPILNTTVNITCDGLTSISAGGKDYPAIRLKAKTLSDNWVKGIWIPSIGAMGGPLETCSWAAEISGAELSLVECRVGTEILYSNPALSISQPACSNKSSAIDLQGRRLTREPSHGVFIKDGKKVMR